MEWVAIHESFSNNFPGHHMSKWYFYFFFHRYCRFVLISSAFITNPQYCLHRRSISATSDECCSVQLIDGDGSFNDTGIESFIKEVELHECGLSYAVVSIMGPQSSVATPK
ncbi:hypothetical protein ES332_D12G050900v1 [Gossypium tomentosum]|uniref:Uncharacterized protein n=1 Tax=Gossypium tomentosum TaxID=34277 RepID=A0A5D2I5A1_GOSTO|nr:hypothetical protein ES332_D12G050900v1 [Gossypium tomentosum]